MYLPSQVREPWREALIDCLGTDICVGSNESDPEIGRVAVLLCRAHKTFWSAGYRTFSSWRDETVEQQKALQHELSFWCDYSLVDPVYCSAGAMTEGNSVISVHRVTADDLRIERTVDMHPEWSLSDVTAQLGLSQNEAQSIIARPIGPSPQSETRKEGGL
jgi:hypothetical protein